MFTLRLTHQDLVNSQEKFLAQLGQLDVERKEIERLSAITSSGAIAGKTRLAREYERDMLMASIRAARQAMLLHGLSERQIRDIEQTRQLVREVTVVAPELHEDRSLHHDSLSGSAARLADAPIMQVASMVQPPPMEHAPHVHMDFLVSELSVRLGQSVGAGESMAQLSDYSELLIEGHAFQRDGDALRRAAESSTPLQAVIDTSGDEPHVIEDLKVVYIGNEVGRDSRALPFYVGLDNEIERTETRGRHRYVSWKYKPGQRLKLRLPVDTHSDVLVVPKNAIADEGAERYVFVKDGGHFDRVSVEVISQDSMTAAVRPGGDLKSGQSIAIRGAHQLQMEFKNRGGDVIDPHAGHNH